MTFSKSLSLPVSLFRTICSFPLIGYALRWVADIIRLPRIHRHLTWQIEAAHQQNQLIQQRLNNSAQGAQRQLTDLQSSVNRLRESVTLQIQGELGIGLQRLEDRMTQLIEKIGLVSMQSIEHSRLEFGGSLGDLKELVEEVRRDSTQSIDRIRSEFHGLHLGLQREVEKAGLEFGDRIDRMGQDADKERLNSAQAIDQAHSDLDSLFCGLQKTVEQVRLELNQSIQQSRMDFEGLDKRVRQTLTLVVQEFAQSIKESHRNFDSVLESMKGDSDAAISNRLNEIDTVRSNLSRARLELTDLSNQLREYQALSARWDRAADAVETAQATLSSRYGLENLEITAPSLSARIARLDQLELALRAHLKE